MWLGIRRVLTPGFIVSLFYFIRFGARVSPRAEIELNGNVRFGTDCRIGAFAKLKAATGRLTFGDRAYVDSGCFITAREGHTSIGDDFTAGPDVHVICGNYRYGKKNVHLEDLGGTSIGIVIGNRVTVQAGAVITDGVTLADDTVVLPNSLVNRSFPPNSVIGGVPARLVE